MPIIKITKEVFEEIGKAVNKNTLEEKDKEIQRLQENIQKTLEYIYENKHKDNKENYDELNYKLDEIANILES